MTKNIKRMFFVLTLITLLVTVGSVCAADDANSTGVTDNSVSDVASVSDSTSDTIAAEPVTTNSNDNKVDTKTIEKENKEIKKDNKTDKNKKSDSITIDGIEYTNIIENQEIIEYTICEENTFINNSTFTVADEYGLDLMTNSLINNSEINAFLYMSSGTVSIMNSKLNDGFYIVDATVIIDENTIIGDKFSFVELGNGKIKTNNSDLIAILDEKNIEYEGNHGNNPYDGNNEITNENITTDITIPITGNITFTQCNISAKITNNGNLTLINCSFSNNSIDILNNVYGNLNLIGFLINNGNTTIINCKINNNTFNMQNVHNTVPCGVIVNNNNAILTLMDSEFENNKLQSSNLGINSLIYNLGAISKFDNCKFINNNLTSYINKGYSSRFQDTEVNALPDDFILTVSDSLFENNTANVFEAVNMICTNSNFINNKYIYLESGTPGGGEEPSGMAITASNLNVDNCTFDANGIITKHQYSDKGGYGGAINAINLTVNNSRFINNIVNTTTTWNARSGTGAAISVVNGEIYNSVFENNYASNPTEAVLPTVGYSSQDTGMSSEGCLPGSGADIYSTGNIIIKNNVFNNSYAKNPASSIYSYVYYAPSTQDNITIVNNTFNQCKSSMDTIVIEHNGTTDITLENNSYTNTTINDEINLNIPNKIYSGEAITITGTYQILNTSFYDADILDQNKFNIYINGVLDQTVDTLDFTVTPTDGTMMVTVQPTISQTRKTQAIRATTLTDITITPENYNEYIYEGVLVGVSKDTRVKFSGEFTDKGDIVFDTNDLIIDGTNATFTHTTFTLDNENITLQNMNINNNEVQYTITNAFNNNIIANNTITVTNTQTTGAAIYNTASNTLIENNTITQTAPAYDIDFSTGQGVASTQAILLLGGDNNTVQNNNINIEASSSSAYGTLEAITNNNYATNTIITQNTINISGANFNYAIDSLNNVENITITENTITVTGERYCDGIQAGNGATNIVVDNNNITCICINTTELTTEGAITYGVIATSMGSYESENITITNNNIDITGTANYGIELYKVNKTEIHNNTITVNGPFSMGIGYAYSPNGNATQNTITITGDSTTPINQITEEFKPENVGIRIQNGTQNISITENTITTSDIGGQDTTIHTEPDNVTIANNQLTSSQGYGDDTIIAPETATIENNIVETTTTLAVPETIIINTPVELTATVTTTDGTPINGGTVTFSKGNEVLAQATVTDGVATATYTFTQEEEDVTIVASYTPESTGLSTSSDEETTTIEAPLTQLNIEEIDLTAGETVTLTATVTDQNGNNINGGKVTFKINGKTIKDASGKVIYAKVVDGVATAQYTVPENLGGQDITVTAVYTGTTKYNKETTTITTTVTAPEAKLTITPITDDVQTGSTVTLKAKVAVGDKAITTGKIVFKVNGKTIKDANGKVIYAKVDANGEASVDYTIPESFKAGTYNIEAVFTAPGYEKLTDNTTMTVVKS